MDAYVRRIFYVVSKLFYLRCSIRCSMLETFCSILRYVLCSPKYFWRILVKQGVLKGGNLAQVKIGLNSVMHMLLFACISEEFRWVCCPLVELLEQIVKMLNENLSSWFN